jgi:hypothetical protein
VVRDTGTWYEVHYFLSPWDEWGSLISLMVAALPGAARGGRGGAGVRRDPSDEFGRRQHLLWRPQQGQAGLPEWQPVRRQGRRLLHPAVHVQKPVPALTIHEHVRAMCDTAGAAIVAN